MTTENLQEQLDFLTNPDEAKKAEQARNRSNFRPPFTGVTCDIVSLNGPYQATLNNGQEVTRMALHLTNMRNIVGETPYAGTEFDLELPVPKSPNIHSEATLMTASAGKDSIRQLVGLKGVRLEERVDEYKGRKQTNGVWADADMETRYYAVTGGSNGASAPAPTISEDRLREAAIQIEGATPADAAAILGPDANDVLAKLILTKRVQQVDGKYVRVPEAATV